MTYRLFIRSLLLPLLFFTVAMRVNAQDSVKNTVAKPVIKKAAVPNPYRAYPPKPGYAKPGFIKPTVVQPGTTPTTGVQPVIPKPVYAAFDTAALKNKSLNEQYQYTLSKIYRYQQPIVSALWKSYADTLHVSHTALKDAKAKITAQAKTIDSLKTDSSAVKRTQVTAINPDTIDVLGIAVAKTTYNIVMGSLVAVLALALVIVVVTTAKYRHEARYRVTLYDELEEEYKTYKAKANEKEKKLARELQTERNKLDDLLGKG